MLAYESHSVYFGRLLRLGERSSPGAFLVREDRRALSHYEGTGPTALVSSDHKTTISHATALRAVASVSACANFETGKMSGLFRNLKK